MELTPSPSTASSSSSSSPSLELMKYQRSSKCQICDKPAHGYHHGALTCRACCIFFRRSAEISHRWKCKAQNNCEISGDGKYCKKCRMEKCFKFGMTPEKFQLDRDAISNVLKPRFRKSSDLPMSLEKFIGRPHIIIRCEPKTSNTPKTYLDLSGLIDKGSNILLKNYGNSTILLEAPSCMQKLANSMTELRRMNAHGKTMKFLKSIWSVWTVLEKIIFIAEKVIRKETVSITKVPLDDWAAIDVENLEIDLSWCTEYEMDKLRYFFTMTEESVPLSSISKILINLQATDIEMQFLILQLCFRNAGRRHQGELLEVSEYLLDIVSNQMHDYYSNILKMPHYAGRVAKLMKCDQYMQEYIKVRDRKSEIAEIFEIFDLQYSHPEVFIDACY